MLFICPKKASKPHEIPFSFLRWFLVYLSMPIKFFTLLFMSNRGIPPPPSHPHDPTPFLMNCLLDSYTIMPAFVHLNRCVTWTCILGRDWNIFLHLEQFTTVRMYSKKIKGFHDHSENFAYCFVLLI